MKFSIYLNRRVFVMDHILQITVRIVCPDIHNINNRAYQVNMKFVYVFVI